MNKDPRIHNLLSRLDLSRRGWQVADHWDADMEAIGIRSMSEERLVYVSVFDRAEGRFYFECERAIGPNPEDYEVVASSEDASFDELLRAMEAHLNEASGTNEKS